MWSSSTYLLVCQQVLQSAVAVCDVARTVAAERGRSESVSSFSVNVWCDPTAKGERSKRMVVCEQHDGVDQLG